MAGFNRALWMKSDYCFEALALFARMTSTPDATRRGLIDTCIKSLKASGVWPKLECAWAIAAPDPQAGRLNWIGPYATITPVNSPSFTADRGYTLDGVSSYLNTGFNPSTATIYSLNSASIGYWSRTEGAANSATAEMGYISGNRSFAQGRTATGNVGGGINQTAGGLNIGTAQNSRLGLTIVGRSNSTTLAGYRNNTSLGTVSPSSVALPSGNLFIGGYNNGSGLAGAISFQCPFAFTGAFLDATDEGNLYSAINTFLTAIGAN